MTAYPRVRWVPVEWGRRFWCVPDPPAERHRLDFLTLPPPEQAFTTTEIEMFDIAHSEVGAVWMGIHPDRHTIYLSLDSDSHVRLKPETRDALLFHPDRGFFEPRELARQAESLARAGWVVKLCGQGLWQ